MRRRLQTAARESRGIKHARSFPNDARPIGSEPDWHSRRCHDLSQGAIIFDRAKRERDFSQIVSRFWRALWLFPLPGCAVWRSSPENPTALAPLRLRDQLRVETRLHSLSKAYEIRSPSAQTVKRWREPRQSWRAARSYKAFGYFGTCEDHRIGMARDQE
jgi:hypothetical protein